MADRFPMRRHTRYPVRWPLLYSGDSFIEQGTLLDITRIGWKLIGPMHVSPGMKLRIKVVGSEKPDGLWIEEATVLWTRGKVFGVEVNRTAAEDELWLHEFLARVLGLWLIAPSSHEPLCSKPSMAIHEGTSCRCGCSKSGTKMT